MQTTEPSGPAPLDAALDLVEIGFRRYRVQTSSIFWNISGPFGGWLFAAGAKAILADQERAGAPIEAHARFLAAPKSGTLEIRVTRLSQGRSVAFWRAELLQNQHGSDRLCAEVSLMLAAQRDTIDVVAAKRPEVALADSLRPIDSSKGPLRWLDLYDVRYVSGKPFRNYEDKSMASVMWVREKAPRPLDPVGLIALADIVAPRTFLLQPGLTPSSTVSMSVHFIASEHELSDTSESWLLMDIDGTNARRGFFDQRVAIWRGDRLLGTSTQLAWFS
jgi:acyl-CoA thioesterase